MFFRTFKIHLDLDMFNVTCLAAQENGIKKGAPRNKSLGASPIDTNCQNPTILPDGQKQQSPANNYILASLCR